MKVNFLKRQNRFHGSVKTIGRYREEAIGILTEEKERSDRRKRRYAGAGKTARGISSGIRRPREVGNAKSSGIDADRRNP